MKPSFLKWYLADKLSPDELKQVTTSFDVVGHIAILRIPPALEPRKDLLAEAVMAINTNITTVLHQRSPVAGVYRTRTLEHVAGERTMETLHREYGSVFKVDLAAAYFSPRLAYERMRVATLGRRGEIVINMFAGVGCFSIIMAKHSQVGTVYSIDLNPAAVQLMQENIALNKVRRQVEAIEGDARAVIQEQLRNAVDRVLMPLPEKAYEYLDIAVKALRDRRGVIHYHDFLHANRGENPIAKGAAKVAIKLKALGVAYQVTASRVVRMVGPRWYQIALDIQVQPS